MVRNSNTVNSMTAFSRQQIGREWGSLVWEIRSVNHRYLEQHIRLPDTLRELEPIIRNILRERLHRGKIECQLRFHTNNQPGSDLQLNKAFVTQLNTAATEIAKTFSSAAPINPLEILQWPGVLQEPEIEVNTIKDAATELFQAGINELINNREREGGELKAFIEQRIIAIQEIVAQLRNVMPEILLKQRQNILCRFKEMQLELEPNRLEQEIVLITQKADVDEELDRLETHINEVSRVLTQKGAVGRRLDFLMQELNREANTLSSKSIISETTLQAVELKVLIEQMREQIQNIE